MIDRISPLTAAIATLILMTMHLGCAATDPGDKPSTLPAAEQKAGFAVVELFTSEGCSSCPPADQVLGDLVRSSAEDGRHVFPIAYHVEYWDRLGWRDRFSSAAATDRQNRYAAALQLRSIYTPQMIVNGREQFVGSDSAKASRAIERALQAPAPTHIKSTTTRQRDGKLSVSYEVSGTTHGVKLVAVAVERELETTVARGENAGRKLRHENVARAWQEIGLTNGEDPRGAINLDLPEDAKLENVIVIVFAQDVQTLAILGATQSARRADN